MSFSVVVFNLMFINYLYFTYSDLCPFFKNFACDFCASFLCNFLGSFPYRLLEFIGLIVIIGFYIYVTRTTIVSSTDFASKLPTKGVFYLGIEITLGISGQI